MIALQGREWQANASTKISLIFSVKIYTFSLEMIPSRNTKKHNFFPGDIN
jgi:hypothetical protein